MLLTCGCEGERILETGVMPLGPGMGLGRCLDRNTHILFIVNSVLFYTFVWPSNGLLIFFIDNASISIFSCLNLRKCMQ